MKIVRNKDIKLKIKKLIYCISQINGITFILIYNVIKKLFKHSNKIKKILLLNK